MNAHNDVKKPPDQSLDARLVLAAARLRVAARVDFLVARWLERCATNAVVTQRWFETDRKPTREFGMDSRRGYELAHLNMEKDRGSADAVSRRARANERN
jgi:hypothetical protein